MKRCLTAIILGLAATSALAESDLFPVDDKTGWNAGIAATFAEYSFNTGQLDDSAAGFKVFGGYRFNKWFGLEGSYYDFGDFNDDLDPPNPGGGITIQMDGLTGSALVYAPLETTEFDVYGKVGYYSFDQQLLLDDTGSESNSPSGMLLGAGARFYVSEQLAVRAEGEWFDIDNGDLWTLNVGIEYLFGRPENSSAPAAMAAPVAAPPPPPPPPAAAPAPLAAPEPAPASEAELEQDVLE